jgi:hypothetical protein
MFFKKLIELLKEVNQGLLIFEGDIPPKQKREALKILKEIENLILEN